MKCPYCGELHPDQAIFCPKTGKSLQSRKDPCQKCGANLPPDVDFCPACGSAISLTVPHEKSKTVIQFLRQPRLQLVIVVCLIFLAGLSIIISNARPLRIPPRQSTKSENNLDVTSSELPQNTNSPSRVPNYYSVSTEIPTFQPTITPATGTWMPCQDSYPSRLHIGDRAYIAYQPPLANRVRSQPSLDANIIGGIQPGETMQILNGPSCANHWVWWNVRADKDGLKGWTAEGDSENYWLMPSP
jgi:hypothetical protein